MESGCLCHITKREKVREEEGGFEQQRLIDGNSLVYSRIVPPRVGAGATWKLSPSVSLQPVEKLSVLNIREKKKRKETVS